jgi:hypothetical protein
VTSKLSRLERSPRSTSPINRAIKVSSSRKKMQRIRSRTPLKQLSQRLIRVNLYKKWMIPVIIASFKTPVQLLGANTGRLKR